MADFWKRVQGWGTSAWQAAAIAAVATLIAYAGAKGTAFQDLRAWTFDWVVLHAGQSAPSPDIVFVDFDEDTFGRIGKWPIPRADVAQVIRKIGEQKPRVVGLDILLSEPREPEEDKAMQDALTSANVVILASQDSVGLLPPEMPRAMFCQPEDPKAASGFCKEGTPGAFGYAFINLTMDPDGFIRQGILFSGGVKPSESFALTLAQQYTGQAIKPVDDTHASFNGHKLYYADRDIKNKSFLIGSWGKSPVTHIPAWKFLSGEIAPNAVTDKLVLVGQSNDAARDREFTPMFRSADSSGVRESMAGTEILGTAIRSLIEGTAVRAITEPERWALVIGVCWLTAFLMLRLHTGFGLLSALVLALGLVVVSLVLYAKYRFWLSFLAAQTGLLLSLPMTLGLQFLSERLVARAASQERKELMSLFSSYVDPAVANTIWQRRDEVSLAGEERIATVMFTDIRNFTAISLGKPPSEVLRWLNRYLTAMDDVIREHGGFLNKFIGDGLMIIFGLPLSRGVTNDAERAVKAGQAMLERVDLLNRQNAGNPEMPYLRIGIGIHTGPLMAGSIGSATRQEYSVIGETVNLASRLESLNKPYHSEIILSQSTYDLLPKDFADFRTLGAAEVKGLDEPVPIFTIGPEVDLSTTG